MQWVSRSFNLSKDLLSSFFNYVSRGEPALSYLILFQCTPHTASLAATWVMHTVETCQPNFQRVAYWLPAISYWPVTPFIIPRSLCAHPFLICYLFHGITNHLDHMLSTSQPHRSGTPCLSAFANRSHFLLLNLNVISRLTFPVSLSNPLATHPPVRPDSLIDYINLLLILHTYF